MRSKGVKIWTGRRKFPVRFLFRPVEIFPNFTKTSGSLRQNIFGKLYGRLLNNVIQKQIFVMRCNHRSRLQMYSKRCACHHMLQMETGAISKAFSRQRIISKSVL